MSRTLSFDPQTTATAVPYAANPPPEEEEPEDRGGVDVLAHAGELALSDLHAFLNHPIPTAWFTPAITNARLRLAVCTGDMETLKRLTNEATTGNQ